MKVRMLAAALIAAAAPVQAQQPGMPKLELAAHRDSFVIMMQGKPVGTSVVALELNDAGAKITESTSMPGMVQNTEITLDAALRVRKVAQTTRARGMDGSIGVEYANGRVRGSAAVPGPQGLKTIAIDTVVPADVLDDNQLQAVLPGLPWSADAEWQLPIYSAGSNTLTTYAVKVTATEDVTVPAGSFRAWKAELRGGHAVLNVWIDTKSKRVLKISPVGAPLEIVLAG